MKEKSTSEIVGRPANVPTLPVRLRVLFCAPGFKVAGDQFMQADGTMDPETGDVLCKLGRHDVSVNRHSLIVAGTILLR
jgi:hypothetical protein